MSLAVIVCLVLPCLVETSRFFCTDFKKVNIVPSSSCHTVSNPTPNIGNCFQSCVNIGSSVYMVSQRVPTNECVCCQLPLLTDIEQNIGEWRSFVREYHTKALHKKLDSNNIEMDLNRFKIGNNLTLEI